MKRESWIDCLLALFGYHDGPKHYRPEDHPTPKPWDDPKRSPADRQAWRDAQPRSLGGGK